MDNLRILKNVLAACRRNQWEFWPFFGKGLDSGPRTPNQNFSTDMISGPKIQHPV